MRLPIEGTHSKRVAPEMPRVARLTPYLALLWPEPCEIEWVNPLTQSNSVWDYIAVPRASDPHLLLPRTPRSATAAALRDYNTGSTAWAHSKAKVMALAAQLGLARLLPGRLVIDEPDTSGVHSVHGYLSDVLNDQVILGIYFGPERAVEKPVLQIITPHGRTIAFAKVGVNELTKKLVRREASNLAALANPRCSFSSTTLRVPRVLHWGEWCGLPVLVQEALPRGASRTPSETTLNRALLAIAESHGVASSYLQTGTYWKTLNTRVSKLHDGDHARTIRYILEAASLSETVLNFGTWHGDFAPWNMTHDRGALHVWDWEHLDNDVPMGFDALHLFIQTEVVSRGATPAEAFANLFRHLPRVLAPFSLSPAQCRLTYMLYVAEIATRYLEDDEPQRRTSLGSLEWLQPTTHKVGLRQQGFR